jgi:DNA-binding CsgD family transcriptional regulator
MESVRSGAPLFRTDDDGVIEEWNAAAERLLGVAAAEAEGRRCWDVIRGRDDDGHLVCHPGCSVARLARHGWPVSCADLTVPTARGPKRITISTIVIRNAGERTVLHPLREDCPTEPQEQQAPPQLTPRQREILSLIATGVRAREIAQQLVLSEATVRNHIRAILVELGVHSQLEAVARARSLSLVA